MKTFWEVFEKQKKKIKDQRRWSEPSKEKQSRIDSHSVNGNKL